MSRLAPRRPGVLQRELLAYKNDKQTLLPTGPDDTMSVTYDTCTGSAAELNNALPPLVDTGDVLATDDGRRVLPARGFNNPSFLPWLIHELTHSWQYQHGISVSTTLYHAIASSYDYGGEDRLRDA